MCTSCGCGHDDARLEADPAHAHRHADGTVHAHSHDPAPEQAHGLQPGRRVEIERDLLAKNDALAGANRRRLAEGGIFALNLVSSPGSGKTTLLVRTIDALKGRVEIAVIEGDQATSRDAERIRAAGASAVQVNTGRGCHLDAAMVGRALDRLAPRAGSVLMIENVGNLVCPAAFDLGETHKVLVLSVTEGDDKPLKYPDLFRASALMLLNKVDLLPHVDFDVARCVGYARRVNPAIRVIEISATRGTGMAAWLAWIAEGLGRAAKPRSAAWTGA